MASGGGGASITSDELIDHKCSVCFKRGQTIAAVVFCVDCQDYYCKTCSDCIHTAPALENHQLISEDVANVDGRRLPSVPTSRCNRHRSKIIDMYCKDHDEVGCYTCMTVDHRTCSVFDIPEFVQTNKKVVPEFLQAIQDIESEFDSYLNTFHIEQKCLHHNKEAVIARIQAEQTRLENSIRKAAENAIEKVDDKFTKMNARIEEKIKTLKNEKDKLKKVYDQTESSSSNVPQSFVETKKNKSIIPAAQQVKTNMSRVELDQRLLFIPDVVYEPIVKQTCLGNITVRTPCVYSVSKIGAVDMKALSVTDGMINSSTSMLYDSCCTRDGSVFFTNCYNNLLLIRVCSKNMKVVEHIRLPAKPRGLCCISDNEIAVCLGKTIQIININDKLQLARSVPIGTDCKGLTYHDDVFYAASSDSVYKYNMEGTLLQAFTTDSDGNNVFSNINNLAINPLSNRLHVTDHHKGVITIDQNGDVVNIVKDEISLPWGVTVDTYGQVLVSGYRSENVIQLTCDGKFIRTVINKGLDFPRALCIDNTLGRLFVNNGPNWSSPQIYVYNVNL